MREKIENYERVFRLFLYDDFLNKIIKIQGNHFCQEKKCQKITKRNNKIINMKQNCPDLAKKKEYFEVKTEKLNAKLNWSMTYKNDKNVLSFRILRYENSFEGEEK